MTYEPNSNRQTQDEMQKSRRNANIAVWIPIGTGLGVALGLVLDNIALGIAIGAAIGVAVGSASNTSLMGGGMGDSTTPGRRWIHVIAVIGGLLLLVGMIILFELLAR
jgi:hypothetical protein